LKRREIQGSRARCISLVEFVREAWRVLEPTATYVHGWHVEAICMHLEAVTRGEINRLLINVPPGSMKSLLVSVLWPAWEWGPMGLRSLRYLSTSFSDVAVKRDTRKMRDLVMSRWYQDRWPEVVLTRTGETSFANTDTGTREGVPFGSLTSQRGDRLIIDDPHSTVTAESDQERANTTRQFREGATNRLNDQVRSAIVVIMQRLHQHDVSGVILALSGDYVHLCLPMEFELERRCVTRIGFEDPRTVDGELLNPERFPRQQVEDEFKGIMGSYAYAGQYQQRPAPREGGMFKRAWFDGKTYQPGDVPEGTLWVRHWDPAATKRKATDMSGARTAGVKMGRTPDGRLLIASCIAKAIEGAEVKKLIHTTASTDGMQVVISLPQDPGQAGKTQKADFALLLEGYVFRIKGEKGDKEQRAEPFAAQCEVGQVYLLEGAHWIDEFLDELCLFPGGARKDIVDACSGCYTNLVTKRDPALDGGVGIPEVFERDAPRPGYDF